MKIKVKNDNSRRRIAVLVIIGVAVVAALVGWGIYALTNSGVKAPNPVPTAPVQQTWQQKAATVLDPVSFASLDPTATDQDLNGIGSEDQMAIPIYAFNGKSYDASRDGALFKSSTVLRGNAVVSINRIVESLLVPGKSTDVFTKYFPVATSPELKPQLPTETQKKKFSDVVISTRTVNFNITPAGISTSINLVGTMKYDGVPAEFQYVLQCSSSDGSLAKLTSVFDNVFSLDLGNGGIAINETS